MSAHDEVDGPPSRPAAPARTFSSIKRSSVALDVVDQVKQMIITGDLAPHQRLPTERELASMLDVSRPTVRESIRALVALNIVEPVQGSGTYVTSLSPDLLAEPMDFILALTPDLLPRLLEARSVIEAGLARLAAERAEAASLVVLADLVRRHHENVDDMKVAMELDFEFHAEVSRAAHSPVLSALLSSISAMGRVSRARTGRDFELRKLTNDDHGRVLEALVARDPDAAEAAMVEHLNRVKEHT